MQARLLEDFDVEEVRESLGIERCWSLYSQHIVKLRSIEIALIKEGTVRPDLMVLSGLASGSFAYLVRAPCPLPARPRACVTRPLPCAHR